MLDFKKLIVCALVSILLLSGSQSDSSFSYVSPVAKKELLHTFKDAWKLEDVAVVHYATSSYRILKEQLPVPEKNICAFIERIFSQADDLESAYHVAAITKDVPACASSQLLSNIGKKLLETTQKSNVGLEDLFYLSSSLSSISPKINDVSFISKSLKTALKSNETLLNLGYAFHIASILPKEDVAEYFDKIKGVMSQVDEIDSKYYQFEGGLTLTSLIVEGFYKLSEVSKKSPPLNNSQLEKFLNYFLSRLTVSRPRGVFGLLQVLSKLTDNDFHIYAAIFVPSDDVVSKTKPTVGIRIVNLFGEPLIKDGPVSASLVSVQKKGGPLVGLKKSLSAASDKVTYTTSITDLNLTPDFYNITIAVSANEKNIKKSIVNPEQIVSFKLTYNILIENFQVGVLDSDQSSSAALNKLVYPNLLKEELSVDSQQRLLIKFSLKDADFNKPVKVQQAFVKLVNKKTKSEATYVCLSDSNRNFKLSIDPVHSSNTFTSDSYEIILILGDVLLSSSVKWSFAVVNFKQGSEQAQIENDDIYYYYHPKPEIKHLFKEPERRPPVVVSNIFTGFVLSPLLILFILWMKLGINLKNFPFTLSAVTFHSGLGSIFVLFGIFWLKLDMFQIIKYLVMLGTITFLSGNKMLCYIASNRKK